MEQEVKFNGFPEVGLNFLQELEVNNNRTWFEANKDRYQNDLLRPAQEFVVLLGAKLQQISKEIRVDDSANGTGNLMRIYRDTRFSPDKTPYKTAVAGMFWEGRGKKTESPAFGFHLESKGMAMMAGMFNFPKPMLEAYRKAVVDETLGRELENLLRRIQKFGNYTLNGDQYARVPSGFDANHPRSDLLRYKGLYFTPPTVPRKVVISSDVVNVVFNHFSVMAPLQQWLVQAAKNFGP